MRPSILIVLVIMMMLAAAGLTGGLVLAQAGPFHVGEGLFPVQEMAEETLLFLTLQPENRAALSMDLLERRLVDLESSSNLDVRLLAVAELQREMSRASAALAEISGPNSVGLRTRFVEVLARVRVALDQLPRLAAVDAARMQVATLEAIAADTNRPLIDLLHLPPTPTLSPSQVARDAVNPLQMPINRLAPHFVVFPPGSAGARHAFFPLTGKHAGLECKACHNEGRYRGTPSNCSACHTGNAPANHFVAECGLCHATDAWKPAHFDHQAVDSSNCQSCHANQRPANHWSGQCSACHSTNAWRPATFNHQAAGATDCQSCHANQRPANHWSGQCSACHSTNAWRPATFNHQAAGATDCQSCHNRPANHWSGQCSACHSTNAWRPATFNHQAAGATDCQSCHANQRPANHWSGQCSACHSTNAWRPATFNHQAAGATDCQSCHNRPANHFDGQCSNCHNTSSWKNATFSHSFPLNHGGAGGKCATCHPGGGSAWTCFGCHDQTKMNNKHKNIPNYESRCMDCHKNGKGD